MEYNRMIAYIYSYNDGMKSKNTGFAKLEVRQNVLKLQINMKGAYSDYNTPWSVNLFYRERGGIRGICLGEIKIKNGIGEYRYTGNASDIEGSKIEFGSIKGLYISCDGNIHKMYASEWDDLGFMPDSIVTDGGRPGQSATIVEFAGADTVKQPDKPSLFAEPESVREEQPRTEAISSDPVAESSGSGAEKAVSPGFAAAFEAAVSEERADKTEMSGSVMLAAAEVAEDARTEENTADSAPSAGTEALDRIIDGREKMFLFADDDLYDVVEISAEDISNFPEANLALANNSFVNHGYYNFRHLILGRMRNGSGCGYFIGVPGVYTRRDRNTASMFGFNYFKFSMRSDVRLGQFGYWYRELLC